MAFFDKILNENLKAEDLNQSILEQIKMLLCNRNDVNWSYFDLEKKIFPLHDYFNKQYLSSEFISGLERSILVNDPRLEEVKCNIFFHDVARPSISINFKIRGVNFLNNLELDVGSF